MKLKCERCDEILIKGMAYRDMTGSICIKPNDKGDRPAVIYPYVCKKCGKVEWYTDSNWISNNKKFLG